MRWTLTRKFSLMLICIFAVVTYYIVEIEYRLDCVSDANDELKSEWGELLSIIRIDHDLETLRYSLDLLKNDFDSEIMAGLSSQINICHKHLHQLREMQKEQSQALEMHQARELEVINALDEQLGETYEMIKATSTLERPYTTEWLDTLIGRLIPVRIEIDAFMNVAMDEVRDSVSLVRTAEDEMDRSFRVFLIALLIVLLSIATFFYWSVIRPLRRLNDGVQKIKQHQFTDMPEPMTRDELADLTLAFGDMAREIDLFTSNLEQQVEERTRQLIRSQKLAAVGRLAAGVAHEINNPMTSILACAEGLERRLGQGVQALSEETAREYIQTVLEEVQRSKRIVDKMLDFSRARQSRFETVNANQILERTVNLIAHSARRSHCEITPIQPEEPVQLCCDPDQIEQVLLNLLINAVDACQEKGMVQVELKENATSVIFCVCDDGNGIAPEDMDHLFEPFFTRKGGQGGTGLGLAVSLNIIEAHQGTIAITSDGVGKGACCTVTLPKELGTEKILETGAKEQ